MQAQPFTTHKMPAVMGITYIDWQDFFDMLVKANKPQLDAMINTINQEKAKRDKIVQKV